MIRRRTDMLSIISASGYFTAEKADFAKNIQKEIKGLGIGSATDDMSAAADKKLYVAIVRNMSRRSGIRAKSRFEK